MSNELAVVEKTLDQLAPRFEDVLEPMGIPPARIIRTVLVSCERTPKLLQCRRQTLLNGAMTFAVLGLECDGATGQGFLIPFGDTAQPVIGYKGFNTMAARSGFTIRGATIREGDHFVYRPAEGVVEHEPVLGSKGRIIGAWALAASNHLPPAAIALDIDELNAVKGKSPGAKKKDSPWNDPAVGFAAMCEKTAKRRLARMMPLNIDLGMRQYHMGARMDEAFDEQGKPGHITPDGGLVIDGEVQDLGQVDRGQPNLDAPRFVIIDAQGKEHDIPTIERWQASIATQVLPKLTTLEAARGFDERMLPVFDALRGQHAAAVDQVEAALQDLIIDLSRGGAS